MDGTGTQKRKLKSGQQIWMKNDESKPERLKAKQGKFEVLKYCKLEIWGKAQRESARRPKSDWGKLKGGGKEGRGRISPASKSRGPNTNALVYAERALSS